jgi:DNA-binding PadR family transcriptional regulator
MTRKDDVDAVLPLKPVDFLVLLVLFESERHGYGIVRDIAARSDEKIRLVPGNLYSVLRRLLGTGLIEEIQERPAPDLDDERRRYYGITAYGKRVLAAEVRRLQALVTVAQDLRIVDRP